MKKENPIPNDILDLCPSSVYNETCALQMYFDELLGLLSEAKVQGNFRNKEIKECLKNINTKWNIQKEAFSMMQNYLRIVELQSSLK